MFEVGLDQSVSGEPRKALRANERGEQRENIPLAFQELVES